MGAWVVCPESWMPVQLTSARTRAEAHFAFPVLSFFFIVIVFSRIVLKFQQYRFSKTAVLGGP